MGPVVPPPWLSCRDQRVDEPRWPSSIAPKHGTEEGFSQCYDGGGDGQQSQMQGSHFHEMDPPGTEQGLERRHGIGQKAEGCVQPP